MRVLKAITTKYISPTDFKGARIRASHGGGSWKYFPYKHELDVEGNHIMAASLFRAHCNWELLEMSTGWQSGSTYVHVFKENE